MDQGEFTGLFCARPQNFAWFLGSGASRTAGLPTATDILWDLKRRYYCREENQDISRQDIQNDAVRSRIQSFMLSRGFPNQWADEEYPAYFEKIFGNDRELQRRYLQAILSEDKVSLSVGNRVLGALIASGFCRAAFSTNHDSVVEKSVSNMGGKTLAAYHLEGSHAANQALNNEEYPIYVKLHGDFRYDSLKNLPDDLRTQNADLATCLVNAANRFGMIVTGYSGRDESIMALLRSVLESTNPFPHGLFWTNIKGSKMHPAVEALLAQAQAKGVQAHLVPIETYDAFMLRLWRNIDGKAPEMDAQVRKSSHTSVQIPLPECGRAKPLLRLNALPVVSIPRQCLKVQFRVSKEWSELRQAQDKSRGDFIFTKADGILCWGREQKIRNIFGEEILSIQTHDLPSDIGSADHNYVKGFLEEALCASIARNKPLLYRTTRTGAFLIVNSREKMATALEPLIKVVGQVSGPIRGLVMPATVEHPHPEQATWSEAVGVSVEVKNGQSWLLLTPEIWVWPRSARKAATDFMDQRRGDRYNKKHDALLDAWVQIILATEERNIEVVLSPFDEGSVYENPSFTIGNRTAFSRRRTS